MASHVEYLRRRSNELLPNERDAFDFLGVLKDARFLETREALLEQYPGARPAVEWLHANLKPVETLAEFCRRTGQSLQDILDRFPSLHERQNDPLGI